MRVLLCIAFAALPAVAAAQALDSYADDNLRWMEQQAQHQRTLQLERDLMALDNRMRAEQAIQAQRNQDLDTAMARARIARGLPHPPSTLSPSLDVRIPDDRLAASNARVRQAAGGLD